MRYLLLIISTFFLSELNAQLFEQGNGVTDIDGNFYPTVVYPYGKEWTTQNLKTAKYANGDVIPNIIDNSQWENLTTDSWANYNNNSQYEIPYGKLYNGYAVFDNRNVCPAGWHVPNNGEWLQLANHLGGLNAAGTKMKSTQYWQVGAGNNESGFSGLPGGSRYYAGEYANQLSIGVWWTSSGVSPDTAWYTNLSAYNAFLSQTYDGDKRLGLSVRCVRTTAINITTSDQYQNYQNVPYDFTINGTTITRLPVNGLYDITDFDIAYPWYASVNDTWLSNNNLLQSGSDPVLITDQPQTVQVTCNSCGTAHITTSVSGIIMTYDSIPYDFTDASGITQTIVPFSDNYYRIPDVANAPFTVKVNNDWLVQNDLEQVSPEFNIDFTAGSEQSNPWGENVQLQCIANGIPDFTFGFGYSGPFVAPWQSGSIHLEICNYSCADSSDAMVTLTLPPFVVPNMNDLTNPVLSGNILTFTINNVGSCKAVYIPCSFPGTTPAGTILSFGATVTDSDGEEIVMTNNDLVFSTTVLNSYDPNVKSCNKAAYINPDEAECLQYVVHFQNEGNYMAMQVVIKDTISELMDLSTFRVLGSKHPLNYSIDPQNRVVTFTFANVFLAPAADDEEGSKGYVVYSVNENENLAVGSEIKNTAYIYFDFNPPIITNTTSNINSSAGVEELESFSVQMYPNPAGDVLHIQTEAFIKIELFDLTGKLLLVSGQKEINTSLLSDGIYVVNVRTEKGIVSRKLVIQK